MKVLEDQTTRKAGRELSPCLNHNISDECVGASGERTGWRAESWSGSGADRVCEKLTWGGETERDVKPESYRAAQYLVPLHDSL